MSTTFMQKTPGDNSLVFKRFRVYRKRAYCIAGCCTFCAYRLLICSSDSQEPPKLEALLYHPKESFDYPVTAPHQRFTSISNSICSQALQSHNSFSRCVKVLLRSTTECDRLTSTSSGNLWTLQDRAHKTQMSEAATS